MEFSGLLGADGGASRRGLCRQRFCVPLHLWSVAAVSALLLGWAPASASARVGGGERALRVGVTGTNVSPPLRTHLHRLRPSAHSAIVGGTLAAQGTWGFMAEVIHYDTAGNPEFFCSGTVVSSNVILTAGHCGVDEAAGSTLDPSGFRVITGAVNWGDATNRTVSGVSQVIVEPGYPAGGGPYDAALLVLSAPIAAPPLRLATPSDLALEQPGMPAFIAGWGETYAGSGPMLDLAWASTVVQGPGYCGLQSPVYVAGYELCVVNPPTYDTGTCHGDSGGPLVVADGAGQPVEIGVTSFGPVDCNTASADFFTRVDSFSSWAKSSIAAVAPPPPPAPPSSTPTTQQLPYMSLAEARPLVRQTLAGALKRPFAHRHAYTTHCSRNSRVRVSCAFRFWWGPTDYYGNVTVYYEFGSNNKVYWSDKYTVRWVNDQCYLHSRHRRRCRIHTKRGTW